MSMRIPFSDNSLGSMLKHLSITVGILLLIAVCYFYIYLPNITNHGESITVPELKGKSIDELEEFLTEHDLRFEVSDSAYSEEFPPLTVLIQFPKAGSKVKENRTLLITLNRVTPPSVPMPNLVDGSRINAEAILKSNELKRGRIILEPSPLLNLVKEMLYKGRPIKPGTRIPKGSEIDLVVGDGNGPADFTIGNLVGDSYERAMFKLMSWDLHLGNVQIPEGADTTGVEPVVFKQYPAFGDSVRVGDPVDIWIAPRGYKEPEEGEEEADEENNNN
jgi:eukaryotic-like serine/threonine-protein kinase